MLTEEVDVIRNPVINSDTIIDSRDMVASLVQLNEGIKKLPQLQAERIFKCGVLLNQNVSDLSMRQLEKLVGISYVTLSFAKTIASKLDNDIEKFRKFYKDNNCVSWNSVANKLVPSHKTIPNASELLNKTIQYVQQLLKDLQNNRETPYDEKQLIYRKASAIRDMILRFVPLKSDLADINYLKYYECCCCGAYPPPPEGYSIRHDSGIIYLSYPVCSQCNSDGKAGDMYRVACMYAAYSKNLEKAYDTIFNR